MKLLLIHADSFEYEVKQMAIKNPEELTEANRKGSISEVLVAFCTVEKIDEKSPAAVAQRASDSIEEAAKWVKTKNIVLYPYAHLSSELGSRDSAISLLKAVEDQLKGRGFNVKRTPFGWYKSFGLRCKGHPLSELSRSIVPELEKPTAPPPVEAEVKVEEEFAIFTPAGEVVSPRDYPFKPREALKALVDKEVFKKVPKVEREEPKYIAYLKKFGIEIEPLSDLGNMRYGPRGALIVDLIGDHSLQLALKLNALPIKGANMFDLSHPAIKKHAELFGAREYEVNIEERKFVLRYAACFQQFAILKDWLLSYRDLPLAMFELADSYRLEQPGEVVSLFRIRKFLMPDLHIFCKDLEEAMKEALRIHTLCLEEAENAGWSYVSIYNLTHSFLENHKDFISKLVKSEGKPVLLNFVPENKYYWVINVEYCIIDALGRPREIGTFQIDVGNAERFGIRYTAADGSYKYPPIIHTAILGSVERYLYAILDKAIKDEKQGEPPRLPLWLSPIQVRIAPVSEKYVKEALKIADDIARSQIRVDVDDTEETVAKKIRNAEVEWTPYMVVLGEKEAKSGKLSVRIRAEKGEVREMLLPDLVAQIKKEQGNKPFRPSYLPRLVSKRPVNA